jgi:alkylation response protein AidB-like acyl-CoA dehydrogenase
MRMTRAFYAMSCRSSSLVADRQAIQWWIADGATKIHACRRTVQDAAARLDRGDARQVASMVKVFATEMAAEILDHGAGSLPPQ